MKKIFYTIMICLSAIQFCFAQIVDVSKLKLGIGFNDRYVDSPFIKKAFIFSISVSVNPSGAIDSIYFSKTENVALKDAMDLNNIRKSVAAEKIFFRGYKNSIVVIPVMALNLNDQYISNQNSLLREWETLFPNVNKFKNKRVVLCKPVSTWFVTDVN